MAENNVGLYCNFKRCRTAITSTCWISSCSHVLCNNHAHNDNIINKRCPVCNSMLDRQFDFVQVNINPSEEYKSIMWVVANFIDENNVEVVPKCWIAGDECFWPTISRDKLKKYIEKATEPDGTEIWKKYKARIIGQKIYDDLQKARQKSNIALIRSDIETDVEEKKRSRIQNKKYIDDDSSDSSSNTSEASHEGRLQKEETTKKFKKSLWPSKKKGTKVVSSPLRVPGDLPDFSLLRRSPRKLEKTPVLQTSESGQSRFKSSTPQPSTSWATQATGSNSGNFEEVCIRNQNITKNFLRQILTELAALKDKLEELQQQPRVTAGRVEEESDFLNILPLKTVKDLEALEEDLQDKTKETEVMVLAGLPPAIIFDIASRAVSFWNFQNHINRTKQSLRINHLTTRLAQLESLYETMRTKVRNDMQMEAVKTESLQNEVKMLTTRIQDANKSIFDKNRQIHSLKQRCDELLRENVTSKAKEEEITLSQRSPIFSCYPITMDQYVQQSQSPDPSLQRHGHYGSSLHFKLNPVTPLRSKPVKLV